MASVILGSVVLAGHAIQHRKEKKAAKEQQRLTDELNGTPTTVAPRNRFNKLRTTKSNEKKGNELPSYESVAASAAAAGEYYAGGRVDEKKQQGGRGEGVAPPDYRA